MKKYLKKLRAIKTTEEKLKYLCSDIDDLKFQRIQRDFALICADRACRDSTKEVVEFNTLCALINVSEMFELKYFKEYRLAYQDTDWSTRWASTISMCRIAHWSSCSSAHDAVNGTVAWSTIWPKNYKKEREIQLEIFIMLLKGEVVL